MKTNKLTPKEFALQQIIPYFKDPSTCGITSKNNCAYLTSGGRMCVAGKNMLDPKKWVTNLDPINNILDEYSQEKILKPEAVGILTNEQWGDLQLIHDFIARKMEVERACDMLNLFTYRELIEASKQ